MSFTIISLNCCLWPVGLRATLQSALKEERCKIIPNVLNMADIGICQEVYNWKGSENKWISLMKPTLHYNWIDSDVEEWIIPTGIWTITRFSIISQSFIHFNATCLFAMTHRVGFLHTTMLISNKKVHIINIHMISDEMVCLFECFEKIYKQQLEQLLSYIKSLDGEWVVGGDFNLNGSDLLIQWFLMQLIKIRDISYYHPTVNTCNNHISFANHTSKHMKVDHFYTTMKLKDCKVLSENVSDHYPIMATVVFP